MTAILRLNVDINVDMNVDILELEVGGMKILDC